MFPIRAKKIQQFLEQWFSDGEHQFGQQRSHYYDNVDGYTEFIENCSTSKVPCFHSVSPKMRMSKMFWEFDHDDKNLAIEAYDSPHLDHIWEQVKRLVLCISMKGAKPLVLYSGNRGFHVWAYVKSEPIIYDREDAERFARSAYKIMLFDVFDDIEKYPNFDRIPTHINSLARVPFSFHQKTGLQVLPLTLDRKPYIPNLSDFRPFSRDYILKSMNKALPSTRNHKQIVIEDWGIRKSILKAMRSSPDHNVRLAYLVDAIYAGKTDEDLHNVFKQLAPHDYDQFKTQYQIDYQRERIAEGVKPFSRDTLIRLGIIKEGEGWAKFD